MSDATWPQLLAELETALTALEQARPDEVENAALATGVTASRPDQAVPHALAARARELQARMDRLIDGFEQRQAAVGSELAAIKAAAASVGDRPIPRFFDTLA